MIKLARIIPLLIALISIVVYFLVPEWGELNLLFGVSVGCIGFGITFIQDSDIIRRLVVILTLPMTVIWWFSPDGGPEALIGLLSVFLAYQWQPTEGSLEENSLERESSTSKNERKKSNDNSHIRETIDIVSEPIGCVMIVTAFLVVGSIFLISSNSGSVNPIVISIGIFSLSFVGLVVGTIIGGIINYLSKTEGTPIQYAVYLAVPIAFIMAIAADSGLDSTIGESLAELTLTAFYGGIAGAVIGALIGAFIGLGTEKSAEPESVYPEGSWERAREKAIETFKQRMSKYKWYVEDVQIDSFSREKGKGFLKVTIVEQNRAPFENTHWSPIERYKLLIDRTGDILDMQSVTVPEKEKYKPSPSILDPFIIGSIAKPEKVIELTKKKPITEVTSEGLLIRIEFSVKNNGVGTRLYPYVEYKIAEIKDGNYHERVIKSPNTWVIDIEPRSSTTVFFDLTFEVTTVLVSDRPIIRLHRKPWI